MKLILTLNDGTVIYEDPQHNGTWTSQFCMGFIMSQVIAAVEKYEAEHGPDLCPCDTCGFHRKEAGQ